jgi:uncharacterized delta-60 repeat protein
MIFSGIGIIDSQRLTSPGDYFFVGGSFTTYKGNTRNRLLKLDSYGNEVAGFDIGTGFNSTVEVVREDANGKIYVAGDFTSYQGVTANRIIRLNADGSKDTSFDNSTGFNNTPFDLRITSSGIYVAGQFTTYKSVAANRIIRLNTNGTRDTGFDVGTGFNDRVNQLAVSGTSVYAAGIYSTYKGANLPALIRILSNGTRDAAFANGTPSPGTNCTNVFVQSDGKPIMLGGAASEWNPSGFSTMTRRLNTNGTTDTTFSSAGAITPDGPYLIVQDSTGRFYLAGLFGFYGATNIPDNIVCISSTGALSASFSSFTGTNDRVEAFYMLNDKIYAGGLFTTTNSVTRNRIVSYDLNGSINSTFDIGTGLNAQCRFIGK